MAEKVLPGKTYGDKLETGKVYFLHFARFVYTR